MGNFLLCSTPMQGHISPMIMIGRHLIEAGHQVRMLTGSRYRADVEAAGVEHAALTGLADYDDRNLAATFPDVAGKQGLASLRAGLRDLFVRTVPEQYTGLMRQLELHGADAVLTDSAFAGMVPLVLQDAAARPPVLAIGVLPLLVASRELAPYGLGLQPSGSALGRLRNGLLELVVQRIVFPDVQRAARRHAQELAGVDLPVFWSDTARLADEYLQLTCPGFEYPRSDLPANVRFVGPLLPTAPAQAVPDWWADVEQAKAVVHVSQGTVDNQDLDRLVGPTLRALACQDVLLVASTGGRPVTELRGPVPANARVAEFLPYERLFPLTDVFVTNAGYGGVQYSLSHGVPLVAAGNTEEKPEVAARVAWSGTGINLHTGTPAPKRIASAVHEVLANPRYRLAAKGMAHEMRDYSALETIAGIAGRYAA
ncbi:MAG TPA: nucleotide disphospho-sugar-binding domain-containing protein [Arthrobacter sp.]|nr:nucleotide disphospho-sugar-binding domain-containing protein [Arthrobacter sp.]